MFVVWTHVFKSFKILKACRKVCWFIDLIGQCYCDLIGQCYCDLIGQCYCDLIGQCYCDLIGQCYCDVIGQCHCRHVMYAVGEVTFVAICVYIKTKTSDRVKIFYQTEYLTPYMCTDYCLHIYGNENVQYLYKGVSYIIPSPSHSTRERIDEEKSSLTTFSHGC